MTDVWLSRVCYGGINSLYTSSSRHRKMRYIKKVYALMVLLWPQHLSASSHTLLTSGLVLPLHSWLWAFNFSVQPGPWHLWTQFSVQPGPCTLALAGCGHFRLLFPILDHEKTVKRTFHRKTKILVENKAKLQQWIQILISANGDMSAPTSAHY